MTTSQGSIDLKDCTLRIVDGTAVTPLELVFTFADGNITWKRTTNIQYRLNRGKLGTTRKGDEAPLEVSLNGEFKTLLSVAGEDYSLSEFLHKEGRCASNVSTGPACEPYAVDLILEVRRDCGTVLDDVITFPTFRVEDENFDPKDGMISMTGKCNVVAPTAVRTALT